MNQEFDAFYGLELLVVTSMSVFSLILVILLAILYPPKSLCKKARPEPEIPYHIFPHGSMMTDRTGISGSGENWTRHYREYKPSSQRMTNRENFHLNSTCVTNLSDMSANRYFSAVKEISRITSKESNHYAKPYSTQNHYAKPYSKPNIPDKPLRSILKNSTNSTLPKTSAFVV